MKRMLATARRFLRILFRANSRAVEIIYEPLIPLLMWGFVMVAAGVQGNAVLAIVFSSSMLWQVTYAIQSCYNLLMLEDVWNHCFKEILLSPLTTAEYVGAKILATLVRSGISFSVMLLAASLFFGYDLFLKHAPAYFTIVLSIVLMSLSIGIAIDALVIFLGRESAFLAWSANGLIIMLSCPSYPVTVFPAPLQQVARLSPYFWQFDSLKQLVTSGAAPAAGITYSFIAAAAYGMLAVAAFVLSIRDARRNGKLARL